MHHSSDNIVLLLEQAANGDEEAYLQVFPIIYDELIVTAKRVRKQWQGDFTLNTTALVHETYLKLVQTPQAKIASKQHYMALAAKIMRQILVNHAVAKSTIKRGSNQPVASLDTHQLVIDLNETTCEQVLNLHEALTQLTKLNERQGKVVELRFFAGLNLDEIAQLLEVSARTIKRDWHTAKIWIHQHMTQSR